jgi:hypothetical protein
MVVFFTAGLTVTLTVAAAPFASMSIEQIIVPVEPTGGVEQLPWPVFALRNWLPEGR